MPTVIVNGIEVELEPDERLNGIQVAERAGFEVPHYCWHPGLTVVASCRMCLVETGRKDPETGDISMVPKLVPGCQTPATDGTVFVTDSQKVRDARAMVEEDLLIRHPIDCPICDKAGECHLQDYHFQHGRPERRADIKPFTSRRRPMGDTVTLFVDRCVMCTRCVRFTREISGTSELMVVNRGAHEEIDVFPGFPLDNKMSGNVVDLCPVGALGDRDFLYSQRVWFMKSHDSVCAGCSTGCSIHVDENQDRVYRLKPRENPHVNKWWMCDDGRYGFKYVHDAQRHTSPRLREATGDSQALDWSEVPQRLQDAVGRSKRAVAILSPFLTVEEAYLLARWMRSQHADAELVLGPIPVEGEDQAFPGGFTIAAEKCPNRRGVEQVIAGLSGRVTTWDDWLAGPAADASTFVWFAGGYPAPPEALGDGAAWSAAGCLVVQELFASPLVEAATIQLPAAAFPERSGSFVNRNDRLQSFSWAVRPPAGVLTEGQLLWRMTERPGLYQAEAIRQELAREIGFFAAASDTVPPQGIDLRVNQLAGA